MAILISKLPKKMKLGKAEVSFYYYTKKKSLREVGKLAGVSGARIQQKMKEWKFERRKAWTLGGRPRFTDLDTYLRHSRITGRQSHSLLLRLVPPLKECEICRSTRKLHLWSFSWPVFFAEDLKVLCSSCRWAKKFRGLDGLKQKEICRRYSIGEGTRDLAKEFGVSRDRIYQVLKRGRKEKRKWC